MALICDHCGRDFTWSGGGARLRTGWFSSLLLCGACATQVRAAMAAEKLADQASPGESKSGNKGSSSQSGCGTLIVIVLALGGIWAVFGKKDQQAGDPAKKAAEAKQFSITCVTLAWGSDSMTVNKRQFDTEWQKARILVKRGDEQRPLTIVVTPSPDVCIRRNDWDKGLMSMTMQPEEQTKELVIEVGALPSPNTPQPLRGEGFVEVKVQERPEIARLKVVLQGWGK